MQAIMRFVSLDLTLIDLLPFQVMPLKRTNIFLSHLPSRKFTQESIHQLSIANPNTARTTLLLPITGKYLLPLHQLPSPSAVTLFAIIIPSNPSIRLTI